MKRSLLLKVMLCLLVLYCLGYGAFVFHIQTFNASNAPQPASPEGYVVFTGSKGRVEKLSEILSAGFQGPVLITGVGEDLSREGLESLFGLSDYKKQLTLDYTAQTTQENVSVLERWLKDNKLPSVALITGDFHLPRSLRLLKKVRQRVRVYPVSVKSDSLWSEVVWREYHKYLATYLPQLDAQQRAWAVRRSLFI